MYARYGISTAIEFPLDTPVFSPNFNTRTGSTFYRVNYVKLETMGGSS
jgi:hypothetical protein